MKRSCSRGTAPKPVYVFGLMGRSEVNREIIRINGPSMSITVDAGSVMAYKRQFENRVTVN